MLAGMYIGFGILLAFTVSGQLQGAPTTKLLMGTVFGVALSLVIIAGSELFTGNNFVLAVGALTKQKYVASSKLFVGDLLVRQCLWGDLIGNSL